MEMMYSASTTDKGYRQATKGLLETLQALRHRVSAKDLKPFVPQVIGIGYHLEEG